MPISAEIIADSISPAGHRLTTFKLRYPKFIHGEFMTHRVISRNASSSRAIPISKMIQEVEDDAFRAAPIYWGREQKGMQSGGELPDIDDYYSKSQAQYVWRQAALSAVMHAKEMAKIGVHKSIVNRILEPFSHINVVATATEWANFFGLRLREDAQPEMRELAIAMWEVRKANTPTLLQPCQWHLPFITKDEITTSSHASRSTDWLLIKVSVARCARVSYESFETGKRSTIKEDLKLYNRLVGAQPLHASPAEHQATPDTFIAGYNFGEGCWDQPKEHGNFIGWRQYRKILPGEAVAPLPAEFA